MDPVSLNRKCKYCNQEKPLTEEFFRAVNNRGRKLFKQRCRTCEADDSASRRASVSDGPAPAVTQHPTENAPANLHVPAAGIPHAFDVKPAPDARPLPSSDSDFAALKPSDFEVAVGNRGGVDPEASRSKRQEFNPAMGQFAEALQKGGGLTEDLGGYIGGLSEQERRFSNRRVARSVSLAAAHTELARVLFKKVAEQFFRDKVTPTGYAMKPQRRDLKRTVVLGLSDLHLGANLDEKGNPLPYRAVEEARRLEYVIRQALDYKPQYRENTRLFVLLNGDIIDGFLQHDQRAGLPLVEQKAVFWHHFRLAIGLLAQQYPEVVVWCQPGNHGRDIARHPGRATSDKWDGHEWECYYALQQMCSGLPNVRFDLQFRAITAIDLYGQYLLMSHGDTEPQFYAPDTGSVKNQATMATVNASRIYGHEFAAAFVGHFHQGRYQPRHCRMVFNAALVPPNGHARASNYIGEPCGQMLWEAVEGHIVGDLRFIEVGAAQDRDERLGQLMPPFRFPAS